MRIACFTLITLLSSFLLADPTFADERDQRLDFYFIDVEGGAATLIVTPTGESLLIDSGYPDNNGRDRDRILKVAREVAGREHLDHAAVTHWHLDHYGNHAALSTEIEIKNFWDRGIPDDLAEDKKFRDRIFAYRAATQNKSKALKAGDPLPLKSGETPLSVKIVTASREVIPNDGPPNPFAKEHEPRKRDASDNAASMSFPVEVWRFQISLLWRFDLEYRGETDDAQQPDRPGGSLHGHPPRAADEQ